MGESIYLYGCMLMLMDTFIIGSVREKIIISYYRYKGGQSAIQNINEVCKLCKNTGFLPSQHCGGVTKRPLNYPDEFFARFTIERKNLYFFYLIFNLLIFLYSYDVYILL